MEARHSGNISEMVQVKGKEKELQFELDYLREQLKKEQDKVKQYQEQVSDHKIFIKVSKGAKIRSRYNQVPHPTQDTNGKVTNSVRHHTREPRVQPLPSR